jgi:hypothetical protein
LAESDNSVSSIDSIMGVPVGRHSTAGRTHLGERTRLDAAYTAELVPRAMSSNEESSSINE